MGMGALLVRGFTVVVGKNTLILETDEFICVLLSTCYFFYNDSIQFNSIQLNIDPRSMKSVCGCGSCCDDCVWVELRSIK